MIQIVAKAQNHTKGQGWIDVYKGTTRIKSYIYTSMEHRDQLIKQLKEVLSI